MLILGAQLVLIHKTKHAFMHSLSERRVIVLNPETAVQNSE
jgi:hypothetical protein